MKRLAFAASVLFLGVTFVMAEEIRGVITKVDGDKITVQKFKKAEKGKAPEKDGDPVTLTADAKVKVSKGTFNKDTKKVEYTDVAEGLKSDLLKGKEDKGVFATLVTDDTSKKVTEVKVGGKKGGGK